MLVRYQDVLGSRGVLDEAQEQIGVANLGVGGKGPVGADAFAAQALGGDDAGVRVTPGSNQAPELRQGPR